tara:strand:- start:16172 stop:17002 length:831 start_codon:yes stop_codon:yes gene_type:complete
MDLQKLTGVYQIRNIINGKIYIGSASGSFAARWRCHKSDLNLSKHHSVTLQRSWKKYGKDAFAFEVLLVCEPELCIANEQKFIDELKSCDPEIGYNMVKLAGSSLGYKHSEESRKKIAAKRKTQFENKESRDRFCKAQKERFSTQESKEVFLRRMADARGKPEVKRKRAESVKSRFSDDEYKKAYSENQKEKLSNPATRKKMSESAKKKPPITEETRRKMSEASKKRVITKETRSKMASAATGKKRTPEARLRMSIARKAFLEKTKSNTPLQETLF